MKEQDKIAQKNPFKVPEGYFEEVNRKIVASTTGTGEKPVARRPVIRLRPYLLAAASVAVLVMLSYTALRIFVPHKENQLSSEISSEEYLSPYLNDLDTYYLEEKAASLAEPEHTSEMSKKEIIDYLLLDNIEINDIYEQL